MRITMMSETSFLLANARDGRKIPAYIGLQVGLSEPVDKRGHSIGVSCLNRQGSLQRRTQDNKAQYCAIVAPF
jgi:hypothetical protein